MTALKGPIPPAVRPGVAQLDEDDIPAGRHPGSRSRRRAGRRSRRGRPAGPIRGQEIRTFATTVHSLLAQRAWLIAEQITLMVMSNWRLPARCV